MAGIKELFSNLIKNIDILRIAKKDKDEIVNSICDIILELESDMLSREKALEERVNKIEQFLDEDIENELTNCDITIKCPYCNKEIDIYMDNDKMDVKCPKCNNIIELEWNYNQKNQNGTK